MVSRALALLLVSAGGLSTCLLGCDRRPAPAGARDALPTPRARESESPRPSDTPDGDQVMSFTLTSTAFHEGERVPVRYTGEGEDVSPPLSWSNPPAETREFALICDDPDAPSDEPWVHWVIYRLPSSLSQLPESVARSQSPGDPDGAMQGLNSWKSVGYRGPLPPPGHGTHRYFYKLYALDTELELAGGASKADLLAAMDGHVLATAELMGTYER